VAGETLVLTPSKGWQPLDLRSLWAFRELGYFFAWRELKLRYKQTAFGALWAILQPVLMTVIFALIFGRLAKLPSEGKPYALFSFVALVPWTFFSQAVNQGSRSLISGAPLVSRVYFPRLLLPLGSVVSFLVDLAVATAITLPLMAVYGEVPSTNIVVLPLVVVLLLVVSLGVAFLLAPANAQYRDVQYVVPFVLQLWLFASPVAYSLSLIPEEYRTLYAVNPMSTVVEGFRFALLDTPAPAASAILVSSVSALLLLVVGAYYFRRTERLFADVL
jgi:lipopolysaccharide transport system permease protein